MNKFLTLLTILPLSVATYGQTVEERYNLQQLDNSTESADVKAYKDLKYNQLFTRSRGWNGGDGVMTVKLPNGDVFWTFNDSYYGVVKDQRARGNCSFPRNSIMVQKSHNGVLGETDNDLVWLADYVNWTDPNKERYFQARTHLRHPKATEKSAEDIQRGDIDQDYLYWAGDMAVINNKLQVYWNGVDKNMAGIGTAVATYSLEGNEPKGYYLPDIPDYKPQKGDYLYMEDVQHDIKTQPLSFDNTLLVGDDGHVYLYHTVQSGFAFRSCVARTKTMDLKSPIEYYIKNGNTWAWQDATPTTDQMVESNIISDEQHHDMNMPWVFKHGDWYYLTAQTPFYGHDIYIFRSRNPWGPFEEGKRLFTLPDKLDKLGNQTDFRYYMINLHTALTRDDELMFSTNSETTGSFWDNYNAVGSADWYRPYFYRVYNWEALFGNPMQTTHWSGSNPSSVGDQNVYLYNLGTGKWFGRGGTWGVEGVQSDIALPLKVEKGSSDGEYRLKTTLQQRETSGQETSYSYVSLADHSKTMDEWYMFLTDRSYNTGLSNDGDLCNLTFEKVDNADNKEMYRIKRKSDATGSGNTWGGVTYDLTPDTYYMTAKYNDKSSDNKTLDDHSVCIDAIPHAQDDGTDVWLLVTETEMKNYFSTISETQMGEAPANFLMKDNDFARNDNSVTSYKTAEGKDLQMGDNLAADNYSSQSSNFNHNPSDAQGKYTYYVGNGKDKNAGNLDGQQGQGDKWTANIHGANGTIYQDLSGVFKAGWYEISVNAFTTDAGSAKLYASVGGATSKTSALTNYQEATVKSVESRPETYVDANNIVNSTTTDENGNTVSPYNAKVRVYLPSLSNNSFPTLQLGVKVNNGSNDAWTSLDNFTVSYLGDAEKLVVLDENKTSMNYITTQNTDVARSRRATVYLHRELTPQKWNSLVIPFDMDAEDVKEAFGEKAILSEFKGAIDQNNPERMYFTETSEIKADHLYIIRPEISPVALTADVKAVDSSLDDNVLNGISLSSGTPVYVIGNVNFGRPATGDGSFPSGGKISGDTGNENYNSGSVQFVGSLISDQFSQNHSGNKQIPKNSYVLAGNNGNNHTQGLWYYRKNADTPAKGFRGWLEVKTPAEAKVQFVINGVLDNSTTGINGLTDGNGVSTSKAHGIYNLNGQKVRDNDNVKGLPSGIYIINGRKTVVNN